MRIPGFFIPLQLLVLHRSRVRLQYFPLKRQLIYVLVVNLARRWFMCLFAK